MVVVPGIDPGQERPSTAKEFISLSRVLHPQPNLEPAMPNAKAITHLISLHAPVQHEITPVLPSDSPWPIICNWYHRNTGKTIIPETRSSRLIYPLNINFRDMIRQLYSESWKDWCRPLESNQDLKIFSLTCTPATPARLWFLTALFYRYCCR